MDASLASDRDDPVVVVGASTSGLYTAGLIAASGRAVRVVDRAGALDPTPRSLIATAQIVPFLDVAGAGKSSIARVDRYELFAGDSRTEVPLAQSDVVVERATLLEELSSWARGRGAEITFGLRVERIEVQEDRLLCHQNGGPPIAASAVVGADGVASVVAKSVGGHQPVNVPLVQAIVDWPEDVPDSTSQVWFEPAYTKYFYWLIPDGPGRGVLGMIGHSPGQGRRSLDSFLDRRNLVPIEYQAARVALYRRRAKTHLRTGRTPIFTVGDAASQVKVSTVGGLVTGFRGATAVGLALTGRRSGRAFRQLRRELGVHLLIRRTLDRFGVNDYERLLALLDESSSKRVGGPTRDEGLRVLRAAVLARPSIALVVLRALLSSRESEPVIRTAVAGPDLERDHSW